MSKTTTPNRTRENKFLRNAAEPFSIPLHDYVLPLDALISIAGKQKAKKRIWYQHTIQFISFIERKLTLTTSGTETHTLTLFIEAQQLTIACSCGSHVATLCQHAYEYLFNAARLGNEYGFTDFEKDGIIETALSHKEQFKIQYTGRHGIRAELKTGLGRIYHLEHNNVTPEKLQTFNTLSGSEENSAPQQGDKEA